MFFPKELAGNLARHLDVEEALKHSTINHHVPGMHYLCLQRRENLTIKLYVFDHNLEHDANGFVVNPHDHRYRFHSFVLKGSMSNIKFFESDELAPSYQWDAMAWDADAKKMDRSHRTNIRTSSIDRYEEGAGYFLDTHELHTIRVHEVGTALLLFQYTDVVVDRPGRLFVPYDEKPECLPTSPMSEEAAELLLRQAGLR